MLQEGDSAPDFSLSGSDGKIHGLRDFAGRYLVLYFYPRDNTPGCTMEAKEFSSNLERIRELGGDVAGISNDDLHSHDKFIEKCKLGVLLLSDESNRVIKVYDAYGSRGVFGVGTLRKTFIIGKDGKILKVYEKVKPLGHAREVLSYLDGLAKGK